MTDLKILGGLSRYHSWRLRAGVEYNLYKQSGDLLAFDEAIASERHAVAAWKQMVDAAGDVYSEDLAFGAHAVGFSRHWKEEYSLLCRDFEQLTAERAKATGKGGAPHRSLSSGVSRPPIAELMPAGMAEVGKDFAVSARVQAEGGVRSVRLRYRHVTQFEDYETAEMSLDSKTGNYVGHIPASFIDPKWDLMYFIETIGNNGAGRMYPDLEVEEPFVIVAVERLRIAGLQKPVEVIRDHWGVPHIYAKNSDDLFFAQGYITAQDRLFQLDLWRRIGTGKLAEVLGPKYLKRDRIARLVRYRGDWDQEWRSYSPDAKAIATAFTSGINAYIRSLNGQR
ncbi:MAG: penicillin acylase family protein, partial [Bryobacteraceae bacterium]